MGNINVYKILVPTIMAGKPIRLRYHKIWDKKIKDISGGLTILTPAKGYWVSPSGETIHERMIPVEIACTPEQMDKIAILTLEYYKQEAIFYYKVSDDVHIVSNNSSDTINQCFEESKGTC